MAEPIKHDEWLRALEALKLANPNSQGWSTRELAGIFQHDHLWVLERVIRPLVMAGKIKAEKRRDVRVDGTACWIPVYCLLGVPDAKPITTKKKK